MLFNLTRSEIDIVDWVEQNVVLDAGESIPGPITLYNFQKDILREFDTVGTRQVVMVCASQVGKTTIMACGMTYIIDIKPCNMVFAAATEELRNEYIDIKLKPIITDCVSLNDKVERTQRNEVSRSVVRYNGGSLRFATSGSSSSMKSRTARIAVIDEADEFSSNADSRNSVDVVKMRTSNFADGLVIMASTPTNEQGAIWQEWLRSDQRSYHTPCPHCGVEFVLGLDNMDTETGKLYCTECNEHITELQRLRMLELGRWIAAKPFAGVAGFHINLFHNPQKSVADIFHFYNTMSEHGFYTQCLGLPYLDIESKELDENALECLFTEQPFDRPTVRTMTVDIQKDRLEYQVQHWQDHNKLHIVKQERITRRNDQEWLDLYRAWDKHKPNMTFVDSAYQSDYVYRMLNKHFESGMIREIIWPIKGDTAESFAKKFIGTGIDGGRGYRLSTDALKVEVHAMLHKTLEVYELCREDSTKNFAKLASITVDRNGVPDDFLEQLTSELLVRDKNKRRWVKKRPMIKNEVLDCLVYGIAARHHLPLTARIDYGWTSYL